MAGGAAGVQAGAARLSGRDHRARHQGAARLRGGARPARGRVRADLHARRRTSSSRSSAIPAALGRERQGVGAHKDSGFVTILLQDEQAGLQVQAEDGGWIDAPPIEGTFVVNIGEILELASNGYLRPTCIAWCRRRKASERLSIAFFLGARLDATVPVLDLPPDLAAAGGRPDAGPAESAVPRGRPQLPEEPPALPSRCGAAPSRRSARSGARVPQRALPVAAYSTDSALDPRFQRHGDTCHDDGQTSDFETLALHGGTYRADPATGAVAVPIYQTTSYQFHDTGHASRLFALEELGNIYTRVTNPTQDAFEQRIAAIEGGAAALAVASGQTASAFALLTLAQAGDNIVSSTDLYGGTWALFAQTLKQFGIETRFVDPADPENFRRATDDKTSAYYAETLPNPKLQVFPIREVADIGRSLGVPLIVDNTAAPLIARPLRARRGGRGLFGDQIYRRPRHLDRRRHRRRRQFPLGGARRPLPAADRSRIRPITARSGPRPPSRSARSPIVLRARVKLLRDIGAAISPFNAFQFLQGLETLPLRLAPAQRERRQGGGLPRRPPATSASVIFPGLQKGETRRRADAYLKGGYGGAGRLRAQGRRRGRPRLHRRAELLYHVANIGDARSLAIHPASTTHQQLTPEDQLADRRDARLRAALGRPRTSRRHHRRPGAGARRGGPARPATSRHARRPDHTLVHTASKGASMTNDMTTTVQPSRGATLLKTRRRGRRRRGRRRRSAARIFAPAIAGPGAEDPARLDRSRGLPFAARLRRRQGHLRQAQSRR